MMKKYRKLFLPFLLVLAALAALVLFPRHDPVEPTPTPGTTPAVTAEPTPSATAEPTPSATVEPTPSPAPTATAEPTPEPTAETIVLDEHGTYDSKEEVALFIHTYGRLPDNFMTKKEARKNGWSSGALNRTIPGKCIGGDVFGNNEKLLPKKKGRIYYECDIGTLKKKSRGAKRIVFSNDGLIYYSDDHYESFELLYGDESQ